MKRKITFPYNPKLKEVARRLRKSGALSKEVVFGRAHLRDRDEEEVRGYRKALELIHAQSRSLKVSEETIRELHRLARGDIGDAGKYKSRDSDIVERYSNGRMRIRFKTVPANETPQYMKLLVKAWQDVSIQRK